MAQQIQVLVLDDEPDARKLIVEYCKMYATDFSAFFEASTIKEALTILRDNSIHLIFLDIQLNGENGFQLFDKFTQFKPAVIFTTAHEQYAVKAFRIAALDYLTKPIHQQAFREAIQRFQQSNSKKSYNDEQIAILREALSNQSNTIKKICVPVKEGFEFIQFDDILYVMGEGNYSKIYTINGLNYLVSKTLLYYEQLLPANFQRIHKTYLVNLHYVVKYNKTNDCIELTNHITLPVSTRAKSELFGRFDIR